MTVSVPRSSRRDPLILLIVILLCAALVGGLYLVARGADSAGTTGLVTDVPTPEISASEVCRNWAEYWMQESGVGVPAEVLEQISNCRQTVDGAWVVPTGPDDPRIARPVTLTAEEDAATAQLRNDILMQINRMAADMPADVRKGMNRLHSSVSDGVVGNVKPGAQIGATRGGYSDYLKGLADQPQYAALVSYIRWVIAERQAAFDQLAQACAQPDLGYLNKICGGARDALSIDFAPWPWDLMKDLTLEPYLKAVANGQTPPPDGYQIQVVTPEAATPD